MNVHRLAADQLDVTDFTPGKRSLTVAISRPVGEDLAWPVVVVTGTRPGPVIAVLGAEHGDELEGPLVVTRLFRELQPEELTGTFVGVPAANLPAFNARTRTSPEDGANLARVFPGKAGGSLTERIAYWLTEKIIRPAAFLVTLHSGGTTMGAPTLVGYPYREDPVGRASAEAAHRFGLDVLWAHPTTNPGRSVSAAEALGVPWLYTEASGGRWPAADVLTAYHAGVRNVMAHLGMVAGEAPYRRPPVHLTGDGNTDAAPPFRCGGLFVPAVSILDRVESGALLGHVYGLDGSLLEECRAALSGRVVFLRTEAVVVPGDLSCVIAPEL